MEEYSLDNVMYIWYYNYGTDTQSSIADITFYAITVLPRQTHI